MQEFINKYQDQINGTLSGFDRLVFRGSLRVLNFGYWNGSLDGFVAQGMEQYLGRNKILFKDYLDHVKRVSQQVKQNSLGAFERLGLPTRFLRDPSADKDAIARQIAAERQLESGLVCALSTARLRRKRSAISLQRSAFEPVARNATGRRPGWSGSGSGSPPRPAG